jgi:hypothetical protein
MEADMPTLHALLRTTANELADMAVETDGLGISHIPSVERWQALDLISQCLASLGLFLNALTDVVPDCRPALDDALAGVTVGSLADRLAGRVSRSNEVDCGALDMFDA